MAGAAPTHQRVDTGFDVPAPTRALGAVVGGLVLVDQGEDRGPGTVTAWASRRGTPSLRSQRYLNDQRQGPSNREQWRLL